jgi:hypothetical protein
MKVQEKSVMLNPLLIDKNRGAQETAVVVPDTLQRFCPIYGVISGADAPDFPNFRIVDSCFVNRRRPA